MAAIFPLLLTRRTQRSTQTEALQTMPVSAGTEGIGFAISEHSVQPPAAAAAEQ